MTIGYNLDGNGLWQNLVDALLENGHSLTLVRSEPEYDHTKLENIKENFEVLSVKTINPFEQNLIKKGISQISLASYFKCAIKKYLSNYDFDLILYATPPVTLASVVKFCKEKYNAKTFLMLKDIFPQNAVDLEMMKKNGLIYKYFRHQEKRYYEYSDFIGCMSQGNVDYVLKHNPEVNKDKIGLFPNSIRIDENKETIFNEDKTVFMFGGNLGKPQNIPFLLEVIKKLSDYDKAQFIIVGSGVQKDYIIDFCNKNELPNLTFKEQVPQDEYEDMLCKADVGLISLDPRFTIPNIPSKFQTYLKLKKPVLAITDVNTDLRQIIEKNNCGWWCQSSNYDETIKQIIYICEHKKDHISKGINGFYLLKEEYDISSNVEFLDRFIKNHG